MGTASKKISITQILAHIEVPQTLVLPVTYGPLLNKLGVESEDAGNKLVVQLPTKNAIRKFLSALKNQESDMALNLVLMLDEIASVTKKG